MPQCFTQPHGCCLLAFMSHYCYNCLPCAAAITTPVASPPPVQPCAATSCCPVCPPALQCLLLTLCLVAQTIPLQCVCVCKLACLEVVLCSCMTAELNVLPSHLVPLGLLYLPPHPHPCVADPIAYLHLQALCSTGWQHYKQQLMSLCKSDLTTVPACTCTCKHTYRLATSSVQWHCCRQLQHALQPLFLAPSPCSVWEQTTCILAYLCTSTFQPVLAHRLQTCAGTSVIHHFQLCMF